MTRKAVNNIQSILTFAFYLLIRIRRRVSYSNWTIKAFANLGDIGLHSITEFCTDVINVGKYGTWLLKGRWR